MRGIVNSVFLSFLRNVGRDLWRLWVLRRSSSRNITLLSFLRVFGRDPINSSGFMDPRLRIAWMTVSLFGMDKKTTKKAGHKCPAFKKLRGKGVEPIRPFGHTVLSRARLPVPPPALLSHPALNACAGRITAGLYMVAPGAPRGELSSPSSLAFRAIKGVNAR